MRIHINKTNIIVFLILALMHNFFYLLPEEVGPIALYDIQFILLAGLIIYTFFKVGKSFISGAFRYTALFVSVLIVSSALAAKMNYGQGVLSGIVTQRAWLVTAFTYFVFVHLIRKGRLDFESFVRQIYNVVTIELILYFVQYIIGEKRMFLHVNYNYRYETLRLYCSIGYMELLAMIATERILRRKHIIKNAAYVAAILIYIVVVNKGRSAVAGFLLAVGLVILLSRRVNKLYKYIVIALAGIIGVRYILTSSVVQDFFGIMFKGQQDNNYNIRLLSQAFYIEKWLSSPLSAILGYGYANSNNPNAVMMTGASRGYLYADNGIFGFLSCYGFLGLIWYAVFLFSALRRGARMHKKETSVLITMVLIRIVKIPVDVTFFYSYYAFDAILLMVLFDLYKPRLRRVQLTSSNKITEKVYKGEEIEDS